MSFLDKRIEALEGQATISQTLHLWVTPEEGETDAEADARTMREAGVDDAAHVTLYRWARSGEAAA